ncbi:3-hexulose-6-phosphate synthase [Geomicrobium halophilum]|uniref:3-hexulose-6-phosphate synthase n=1 Tax=Geomicrobium halophilum TaxID=549000 RepID=A0A841PQ91_9BACL|nr:3-hexulose-6-phosphate synthase [Geomicrobium halophilum]MBB6449994.1 3-hexulose-6-phosphate synthase [Geomicrobium halophilum]
MKIQLALDRLTEEKAFEVTAEAVDYIDWIEIGTGVIKEYGVQIVSEMKARYPHKVIVADMKTCDAGKHETEQALKGGADITTVMAFAADQTITDALAVAEKYGKRVMIDLLGVIKKADVKHVEALGAELVSLHFGKDMQKKGQMERSAFDLLRETPQLHVAVAGGINEKTLPGVVKHQPETVIIGSAITGSKAPGKMAARFQRMVKET